MSVLRMRVEVFFRQGFAEPVAVSYQSNVFPEVTLDTLVSLLQGCRVLQQKRQPCKCLLERFFAFNTKDGRTIFPFCLARLIDGTSWTHLAAVHGTFLYPFAFRCRIVNLSQLCVDGASLTAMTDVCTRHHAGALSDVCPSMASASFKLLNL